MSEIRSRYNICGCEESIELRNVIANMSRQRGVEHEELKGLRDLLALAEHAISHLKTERDNLLGALRLVTAERDLFKSRIYAEGLVP